MADKSTVEAETPAVEAEAKAKPKAPTDGLIPEPPGEPPGSEMTERGKSIRGVYLPIEVMVKAKPKPLADRVVDKIGADAVVIDIKDDSGRIAFPPGDIPNATSRHHGFVKNMAEIVDELRSRGVYVIGRVVTLKDRLLQSADRSTAIINKKNRKFWRDKDGRSWVDPHSRVVRKYIADIAKAAQDMGFDEIQLDYVRFPSDAKDEDVYFQNRTRWVKRHTAIAAILAEVDRAITIPLSVDVFGLNAFQTRDLYGLGQTVEYLAPYIDALSPMLYWANWPPRVLRDPRPQRVKYQISEAVRLLKKRLPEEVVVRPFLQAFRFRANEMFGPEFIKIQSEAAYSSGAQGEMFWNPNGNYGVVAKIWKEETESKKGEEAEEGE